MNQYNIKSEISPIELNYLKRLLTTIIINKTDLNHDKIYTKITTYDNHSIIFIDTKKQLNELYIKLIKSKDRKEIIISRIIIERKKEGIGTEILNTICTFGWKYDYQILTIDSPNTDCEKFMKRMGFDPDTSWSARINKLRKSIKEYKKIKNI
jgi:hypothetical protein